MSYDIRNPAALKYNVTSESIARCTGAFRNPAHREHRLYSTAVAVRLELYSA
jgi:hypothetical protein